MSASQNKKKTLSLGLALIPVISMLLLLIIGYGIMGLRIEPLLLCSAAVAAGIAWWQGYCWEDIINSVVDKLAKAMPVIMILICVGGLIGTWMFSGTIPYMVYWGLKLISPEYILIAAFFLTIEHIQHLLWTTLPSFLLAAVVYLIAGHSNMLGEVATPQRVTDIIHSLESLYHFNIVLMFPQGAEGVVADVPRLLNRGGMFSMMGTILLVFCAFSFAGALTLTGALTIIINRLLTIIHSVGQLIAATIGTTILVTGIVSSRRTV
ncbi:putative Na+/H+ antiporter [Salmonella enterica subsp. enterica serovar Paratyphi A]|nr:putative Na+/H+ antiporter [Salmonella enterica subsp. enterica serovar Paratyphi A]